MSTACRALGLRVDVDVVQAPACVRADVQNVREQSVGAAGVREVSRVGRRRPGDRVDAARSPGEQRRAADARHGRHERHRRDHLQSGREQRGARTHPRTGTTARSLQRRIAARVVLGTDASSLYTAGMPLFLHE